MKLLDTNHLRHLNILTASSDCQRRVKAAARAERLAWAMLDRRRGGMSNSDTACEGELGSMQKSYARSIGVVHRLEPELQTAVRANGCSSSKFKVDSQKDAYL